MDFRDNAGLDASQVEKRGRGMPRGGLAVGGGAAGVLVLLVALLLGVDPGDLVGGGLGGGDAGSQGAPVSDLAARCKKGSDADQDEECRVVGVVNSIQAYWAEAVPQGGYRKARTVLFSGGTQSGCGAADSSMGPFYCPADERVYLDLSFFDELRSRFGATGGPFAQAYVIAHEYGHHVQNLTGAMRRVGNDRRGATSASVRLELQADCYAGVWARNAVRTGFYERDFTETEIRQALDAAAAVGDDRIQERTQGRVDPEGFTHGTSEQRVKWFTTGYSSGDPGRCDTFRGAI